MKNTAILLFVYVLNMITTTAFVYCASQNKNDVIHTTDSYKNAVISIQNIEEFKHEIQNTKKIALVEFYSDWCTPCRKMAPILNEFALNNFDKLAVYKVNFDYMQELVRIYNVYGLPTIIIFMNAEEVRRVLGYRDYKQLESLMDALLNGLSQ